LLLLRPRLLLLLLVLRNRVEHLGQQPPRC
jgi:hypothetical protein